MVLFAVLEATESNWDDKAENSDNAFMTTQQGLCAIVAWFACMWGINGEVFDHKFGSYSCLSTFPPE